MGVALPKFILINALGNNDYCYDNVSQQHAYTSLNLEYVANSNLCCNYLACISNEALPSYSACVYLYSITADSIIMLTSSIQVLMRCSYV